MSDSRDIEEFIDAAEISLVDAGYPYIGSAAAHARTALRDITLTQMSVMELDTPTLVAAIRSMIGRCAAGHGFRIDCGACYRSRRADDCLDVLLVRDEFRVGKSE